jgi:hypothetical protein
VFLRIYEGRKGERINKYKTRTVKSQLKDNLKNLNVTGDNTKINPIEIEFEIVH